MAATSEVFLSNEGDNYFRPDDICAAPDGRLYVSDWYDGGVGGHGYNIDQGATLICGITPLVANLRIDITFVCLEMRAPRNFAIR